MSEEALKVIAGAPDLPLVIEGIPIQLQCYVLEDETRVLSQRGLQSAVALGTGGGQGGARRMTEFLGTLSKRGLEIKDLMARMVSPVEFQPPKGRTAYGYPADILNDICDIILEARNAGILLPNQLHIARQCEVLTRGLARVGIIARIDEVTGYQRIRGERALAIILEKFIAKELQPWAKTFPYEFYEQIFRLKGWPGPDGVKRPGVIGHYTNDFVYARVAPGVLEELRKLNPSLAGGGRKWRHHQWFKPDPGYIKLNQHLASVVALMRASANWTQFERNLKRAFPKIRDQLDLDLGDT